MVARYRGPDELSFVLDHELVGGDHLGRIHAPRVDRTATKPQLHAYTNVWCNMWLFANKEVYMYAREYTHIQA